MFIPIIYLNLYNYIKYPFDFSERCIYMCLHVSIPFTYQCKSCMHIQKTSVSIKIQLIHHLLLNDILHHVWKLQKQKCKICHLTSWLHVLLGGSSGGRGGGQVFIAGMVTNFIGKGTSSFELLLKKGREKTFFSFCNQQSNFKIYFLFFIYFFFH